MRHLLTEGKKSFDEYEPLTDQFTKHALKFSIVLHAITHLGNLFHKFTTRYPMGKKHFLQPKWHSALNIFML